MAKMMNKYFINIKVDREERPDVDRVYMNYLQVSPSAVEVKEYLLRCRFNKATSGGGGWPLSVLYVAKVKSEFVLPF